jgi:putative nucleotidyltransferase with HDIG domain
MSTRTAQRRPRGPSVSFRDPAVRPQHRFTSPPGPASHLALVCRLGELIDATHRYTFGHCERVAEYAVDIARRFGFLERQLTAVRLGAHLHDLGKVCVPSEILNKPGPLTAEEIEIMQTHPVRGVELLEGIQFPWDIKPIIRWHHERYDGSGYPDGLRGEEIPIGAQIIGIADAFDALTTTRSYRPAVSVDAAVQEIRQNHRQWNPEVYLAFVSSIRKPGAQTLLPH